MRMMLSPVELRIVDVRRTPPTGVRANQYLAILATADGARRLRVPMSPDGARHLALALTGSKAGTALRQAGEAGRLALMEGAVRALWIIDVRRGSFVVKATVAGAEGAQTRETLLPGLLPQALVSGAPITIAPAVLDALERSQARRIAEALDWGYGEGTLDATTIAAMAEPPPMLPEPPAEPAAAPVASPRLAALEQALAAGDAPALDAFWQQVAEEGAPLVEPASDTEGESLVTFLWRATEPVVRVAVMWGLAGVDARRNLMERLGDTDLWYRTYRTRDDARFAYQLSPNDSLVDFDDLGYDEAKWRERCATFRVDLLNRHPFPDDPLAGPVSSTVALPLAPPQLFVAPRPGVPAGNLVARRFRSALLGNERDLFVYTPPGYAPGGPPCDVLVLFDGWAYLEYVPTPTILDNLLANGRIPPLIAVIVDYPAVEDRSRELLCNPHFADFLAQELLPWAAREYRVTDDPAHTVAAGSSYGGLAAAYAAFRHPERFGGVLSQSGAFWWPPAGDDEPDWLTRQFVASPRLPVRFYLEVGLLEGLGAVGTDQPAANRRLRDVLRAKGYAVRYEEYNGGRDYVRWRGTLADGLIALLGGGNQG